VARFVRWGNSLSSKPSNLNREVFLESIENTLKADRPAIPYVQLRNFAKSADIEKRAGFAAGRIVRGLAIPYGVVFGEVGGLLEMYRPGSFQQSIAQDDTRCLINHDWGKLLGRKSSGSLSVWEDSDGVRFEDEVPKTSWGGDLLESMRRGDIDQSGAVFYIQEYSFQTIGEQRVRVVTRGKLLAVSIVSFSVLQGAVAEVDAAIAASRAAGFKEGLAHANRQRSLGRLN
jgi:HK97 family phage prohead protease